MEKRKWNYGNHWEKYPIEYKEIWSDGNNMVCNQYIQDALPSDIESRIKEIDLIYSDTPWNVGNCNAFHTKNEDNKKLKDFSEFYVPLFDMIKHVKPKTTYLEIGEQYLDLFKEKLGEQYSIINDWQIVYYGKHPCYLIRGSETEIKDGYEDYTGKDDTVTPMLAIRNEGAKLVLDMCIGRGGTAVSAIKNGCNFIGIEMNKYRLAHAIQKVKKLGIILTPKY